jgi:beta-N-acetylhexosaminidase
MLFVMLQHRNNTALKVSFLLSFLLMSCAPMPNKNTTSTDYLNQDIELTAQEISVAQRMMVGIRYFCQQATPNQQCLEPVTKLPVELSQLIEQTSIAGVVLFADNIESHQQVIELTERLQQAAQNSFNQEKMLIGIDQEGGRVVRLNRNDSTSFSGNMAIGATYPTKGTYYATEVGHMIGRELNALGINLNFAPDVDVNNNPDNPVINVRSFGEDPEVVADLGIAMADAFQAENVIATLKHFPGHGNTSVDSHTGLPSVSYDRKVVFKTDLLPYKKAIQQSKPGMVMTAHIQFPALDDQQVKTINNENIVVPATLSKPILTDLLKNELGFKGVVITDALNMAGISHHFDLEHATSMALLAGADIALMPFKIRYPSDVARFKYFVRGVTKRITKQPGFQASMQDSLARIKALKTQFNLVNTSGRTSSSDNLKKRIENAHNVLASQAHRSRQKQLAYDSITLLKSAGKTFPLSAKVGNRIHIIVQDSQQQSVVDKAFQHYWARANQSDLSLSFSLLAEFDAPRAKRKIANADSVVLFFSERRESAVVKGEVDDLKHAPGQSKIVEVQRKKALDQSLQIAKHAKRPIYVIGMQSPYEMRRFMPISDSVLTAYDASIYQDTTTNEYVGITYNAVVATLLGVNPVKGQLPVSLQSNRAMCTSATENCQQLFSE